MDNKNKATLIILSKLTLYIFMTHSLPTLRPWIHFSKTSIAGTVHSSEKKIVWLFHIFNFHLQFALTEGNVHWVSSKADIKDVWNDFILAQSETTCCCWDCEGKFEGEGLLLTWSISINTATINDILNLNIILKIMNIILCGQIGNFVLTIYSQESEVRVVFLRVTEWHFTD